MQMYEILGKKGQKLTQSHLARIKVESD